MRRGLAGLWLVLIVVMVSACGAPQYTFVASSDSHAFFKVPGGWHKISDSALAHALRGGSGSTEPTGVWAAGYDGSSAPSASHVFGAVTPHPFAFTNADNTEIYLLVLHCTVTCYQHDHSEIDTVMQSFTIRSN